MKRSYFSTARGFTLAELMITIVLVSVLGLIIYAVLGSNMVLAAKNSAINATHEEARTARLNMLRDIHSSISAPALTGPLPIPPTRPVPTPCATTPTPYPSPVSAFAEGIYFQKWAVDTQGAPMPPFKIYQDAPKTQNYVQIAVLTSSNAKTLFDQWMASAPSGVGLIIPTYQIEADIQAVAAGTGTPGTGYTGYKITLNNFRDGSTIMPSNSNNLPFSIVGTTNVVGDIVCFIVDRCSYTVSNNTLWFTYRGTSYPIGHGTNVANSTPFYMPTAVSGGAFAFSASDTKYSNRRYKSGNVLLNDEVPIKARLTTYQ
jgi:prepilin-type N-terminal cleavage/methylation domain-containing protein